MRESVAIVVVLYKAEMSVYHERLLEDEMVTLVVVDNTPDRDLALKKDRLIYVPLQRNMGIATAQNEGIRQAECLGCDYIIFFDQDSKIPERYSEGIIEEYKRIEQLIPNLFLLGPTIINGRTEEEYKSTIHKDIWMTEDFIRRREIISSGFFCQILTDCLRMTQIRTRMQSLLIMWIMNGVGERRVKGLSMASP